MDPFAQGRLLRPLLAVCYKSRLFPSRPRQIRASFPIGRDIRTISKWGRTGILENLSSSHRLTDINLVRLCNAADPLKQEIRDKILTVPNLLCFSRIGLSPVLAYLILTGSFAPACGTLAVAGLTDLLDGFIARSFPSQQSAFGTALDPLADKLLVSTVFVSLTYVELMPMVLTALIISRDVLLLSAGFYVRFISLPRPKSLRRYFDPTIATAKMFPTTISKVNTAVQLAVVGLSLGAPVLNYVDSFWLQCCWWTAGITTIWSGLSYVTQKNTYEVLGRRK